MLYVTTYYDNVKSRRRVRQLLSAGRVGDIRKRRHSSGAPPRLTATACWSARPAQGYRSARSDLIRKTPRHATGLKSYEISPARQNHPGQRYRLLRSPRRQTKLSAETPPGVSAGFTATGRQAQFLPFTGKHTFANAPGFRDEVPASPLAQLPMDFGRIVLSVKPGTHGSPLSCSARTVPTVAVPGRGSHLGGLLRNTTPLSPHFLSLPAPLGFPPPNVP